MARYPEVQYINAYVSGSMAYQCAPATKKKVTMPKQKKMNKIVIPVDPAALVGIVLAFVCMIMLVGGFMRLQDAKMETAQLESYVSGLQSENKQLQDTYNAGYDLEEVEKIAIAIGMVPKNEVTTVTIDTPVTLDEPEEPTGWEAFWNFLTGLFA